MAENSKIEWCDHTFNPWIGCTKVSPGCDHCYAATQDKFRKWTPEGWGGPRKRTKTWGDPKKWNAEIFFECPACHWRGSDYSCEDHREKHPGHPTGCPACGAKMQRARARVFCASLADVLDNEVFIGWLIDFLDLCRVTPHLDKLLLTKRIGNVRRRLEECVELLATAYSPPDSEWPRERRRALLDWLTAWLGGNPPIDVWLGATIVNQEEADRDIPKLLATSAAVRFVSMEPLLGPVGLDNVCTRRTVHCEEYINALHCEESAEDVAPDQPFGTNTLDWVIVGGESGPGARPMHPDWVRSLRDQCKAAGVPFLFKQWGEWNPGTAYEAVHAKKSVRIERSGAVHPWPPIFNPGSGDWCMHKVGKKAAGRLLDGVTHNGFPESRA